MSNRMRILVTGAGGFIGHHLVKRLRSEGHWVRGVDLKSPEYEATAANEFELLDLRKFDNCLMATRGAIDAVYNLAADMGGIGFITAYHADIARNNILINAHMLEASRLQGVRNSCSPRLPASIRKPNRPKPTWPRCARKMPSPPTPNPAMAGKSFIRRCSAAISAKTMGSKPEPSAFTTSTDLSAPMKAGAKKPRRRCAARSLWPTTARRLKSGATASRRVPSCTSTTVSKGSIRLMASNYHEPLNLGNDRLITINALADLVATWPASGSRKSTTSPKPQGVRGRNSNNCLIRRVLGWEPPISLEEGLAVTYSWIERGTGKAGRLRKKKMAHA